MAEVTDQHALPAWFAALAMPIGIQAVPKTRMTFGFSKMFAKVFTSHNPITLVLGDALQLKPVMAGRAKAHSGEDRQDKVEGVEPLRLPTQLGKQSVRILRPPTWLRVSGFVVLFEANQKRGPLKRVCTVATWVAPKDAGGRTSLVREEHAKSLLGDVCD